MMKISEAVGDWSRFMYDLFYNPEIIKDLNTINKMYLDKSTVIYPDQRDVFRAFKECSYDKLSVVILLQDPYHDGSATG